MVSRNSSYRCGHTNLCLTVSSLAACTRTLIRLLHHSGLVVREPHPPCPSTPGAGVLTLFTSCPSISPCPSCCPLWDKALRHHTCTWDPCLSHFPLLSLRLMDSCLSRCKRSQGSVCVCVIFTFSRLNKLAAEFRKAFKTGRRRFQIAVKHPVKSSRGEKLTLQKYCISCSVAYHGTNHMAFNKMHILSGFLHL